MLDINAAIYSQSWDVIRQALKERIQEVSECRRRDRRQ